MTHRRRPLLVSLSLSLYFSPALAALAACVPRVDYDGTQYLCEDGVTCPEGYRCVDGRCQGGPSDPGAPDAAGTCPPTCDSCEGTICAIDCSGETCRDGLSVTCPAGWTCRIDCAGTEACREGGVDCAGDCEILCTGERACEHAPITCTGASCVVTCDGPDSCDDGVRCDADDCAITCAGNGACEDRGVCCASDDCGDACTASDGGSCACSP